MKSDGASHTPHAVCVISMTLQGDCGWGLQFENRGGTWFWYSCGKEWPTACSQLLCHFTQWTPTVEKRMRLAETGRCAGQIGGARSPRPTQGCQSEGLT